MSLLSKVVKRHAPQMNENIMRGIATITMTKVEAYLDRVFKTASASFPPGLTYDGYARCTPIEEYRESTRAKNNRRSFNIAHSDVYMVKYMFSFNGELIPERYIFLPYVHEGGLMSLSGTKYHISPVLSDKVISPGFDNIFVRLLRDRIIFKRKYHSIIVDGKKETSHLIWSNLYRNKSAKERKVPDTTKADTCAAHYLFGKFGFSETFKRFLGFIPIVGEEDINETNYPAESWVIVESTGYQPRTCLGNFYNRTNLKLAIPRDRYNNLCKALVLGFYYVVDHFPERFRAQDVDNVSLWLILLGHIIYSGVYGENKLYTSMVDHYVSLDDYVDPIVIEKLCESGYQVTDFYSLIAMILDMFNALVLDKEVSTLSMFGKSLETLYYVLYEITAGVFKANFKLSKIASKKPLTQRDVIEAFNKYMKPGAIFRLTSGKLVIETIDYSGDHYYPKITALLAQQESTPGGVRGKSSRLTVGEGQHADASMLQGGSILYLSKSDPTPLRHINPYACVDMTTATVISNKAFYDITTEIEEKLRGVKK